MRKIINTKFFDRPALEVCPHLLGKYLLRKFDDREEALMITEVEAYLGEEDMASHARFGKNKRNEAMFGPAGYWYIYLCYGIHWMLNVVVDRQGYPSAILIRGSKEVSGPGKLSKQLKIDMTINQQPAQPETSLWFEDRGVVINAIHQTPRIGIDYAGSWSKKPYRYILST